MGRANNSSVDTTKGDKIAQKINVYKNNLKAGFNPNGIEQKEQVINARKGVHLEALKAKRKKAAKLAKATKRKNKK